MQRSMNDAPLISIITAVLNQREGLPRTIAGIVRAHGPSCQYIVIDGGSTDGTIDVIKSNQEHIDFSISEPDRGISHAFNKGIAAARGEVIGILNAGDWYEPSTLSTIAEVFRFHPDVDVFCGSLQLWEKGQPQLNCLSNPAALEKETSVYHPTVFIKKNSYLNHGTYDESYRYAMDYELLLRFKRRGAKFLSLDKTLANMTLDGISHKNWYSGLKEVRKARSMYFPRYNVLYYHTLAVLKNLIARALKRGGLQSVYQAYWQSRNRRIASNLDREA